MQSAEYKCDSGMYSELYQAVQIHLIAIFSTVHAIILISTGSTPANYS
jgi:hypothetical protein